MCTCTCAAHTSGRSLLRTHSSVVQNRQRALPRGVARWFDQAYERLLAHLQGRSAASGSAASRAGVGELESVHSCVAQTLGKLRRLFGDGLAAKSKQATMFPDLKDSPVNVAELSASLLGREAG